MHAVATTAVTVDWDGVSQETLQTPVPRTALWSQERQKYWSAVPKENLELIDLETEAEAWFRAKVAQFQVGTPVRYTAPDNRTYEGVVSSTTGREHVVEVEWNGDAVPPNAQQATHKMAWISDVPISRLQVIETGLRVGSRVQFNSAIDATTYFGHVVVIGNATNGLAVAALVRWNASSIASAPAGSYRHNEGSQSFFAKWVNIGDLKLETR